MWDMRLLDLDAMFLTWSGTGIGRCTSITDAQGVMFQCPKCAEGKPFASGEAILVDPRVAGDGLERRAVEGAHRVICWFSNPARGEPVPPAADQGSANHPRWMVSGSSLLDLTLTPSVNLDVPANTGGCRWHGWVTGGEAR
jgi:hypothetical protein